MGPPKKKLEFLFFWNSNFWSIQLPKSYGFFFPLNWKSKEIWEKMPVNYPSCRRIFMNFGNFWVQEKKIHVKNCRFWGGKLEFLFFGTLTFWGDSNFWVLLIILPWGWTGLNHLLWTPAACEQLFLVSQMPFWICLSCSLFLGVKAFLWNPNFWEAPRTGLFCIQKMRVPFFLEL